MPDENFEDRIARLYATDPEFAAAKPSASVNAAVSEPGLTLPDVVRTVLTGYADRPALGARAVEFVTDETGRTVAELQPRFETITHGQLWERVRTLADVWRPAANAHWDDSQGVVPSIVLSFMPMSHVMGRGILYSALASGGSVNFAARADLSTFLEDLALTRPTQMNFVPRIWDMLHQEYLSQIDGGATVDELRLSLLGGRFVTALTGSAPISPELKTWVEDFLDMHVLEGYGSTEAGAVFVDGVIR